MVSDGLDCSRRGGAGLDEAAPGAAGTRVRRSRPIVPSEVSPTVLLTGTDVARVVYVLSFLLIPLRGEAIAVFRGTGELPWPCIDVA